MGEFDLIERFFTRPARRNPLGPGDDCALLAPRPGMQLAVSTDMLVEGRHFFPDADPKALGHKALAVNLSDLAACGAQPLAFTLALALPRVDERWLSAFSRGLLELADAHACELVGGDTTRGPLDICITVFGEVPEGQALLRSGSRAGDDVYASGTIGDARVALDARRGSIRVAPEVLAAAAARMDRPSPRVALGQALRGIATSAIDVSDGLAGDLQHVLRKSSAGATLESEALRSLLGCAHAIDDAARQLSFVLGGGDDYELVFTAPPSRRPAVERAATQSATRVTRIGRIDAEPGLRIVDTQGRAIEQVFESFDHFA